MVEPRVYRASSLGYSLERLVAPHLGYEAIDPPEYMQKAFDEGNRLEEVVIEKLRAMDWVIGSEQMEVGIDVIPGVAEVVGHIDGITKDSHKPTVLEIKTMNKKSWWDFQQNAWDSKSPLIEKYKWQASAYMLATGLPHVMVAWNKETGQMAFGVADEPFFTISDIANKLQQAEDAINAGVIPEGCTDFPCPFFYLHAEKEEPEPADAELDRLLTAWSIVNHTKKEFETEEKALREQIKEYVGEEMAGKVKGSQGVVVSTTWVPEKEVSYMKAGHWETRITPPRKGKDG